MHIISPFIRHYHDVCNWIFTKYSHVMNMHISDFQSLPFSSSPSPPPWCVFTLLIGFARISGSCPGPWRR